MLPLSQQASPTFAETAVAERIMLLLLTPSLPVVASQPKASMSLVIIFGCLLAGQDAIFAAQQ